MSEERYNPADKFGTPEDAPQTYLLEDGREVDHEEFMKRVREDAKAIEESEARIREARKNTP